MPDNDLLLTRSINPVQRVQGYVERGGALVRTIGEMPRLINAQELLPDKHVRLYYAGTDDPAPMYKRNGTLATLPVRADENGFFSFYAETGQYDIRYTEPDSGSEIFRLLDVKVESQVFNVRDFGARGDGDANNPNRDDAVAFRAAIAVMVEANGNNLANGLGTLSIPNGVYIFRSSVDLPSGITIQGTNSQYSGIAASNCLIVLATPESSIFTIATNRQRIILRDFGMTTLGTGVLPGTRAIDAREDSPEKSVSGVEFDNLTIWSFDRGISVEGLEKHKSEWDFNNARVNHCSITECNYAIYLNSQNCDFWRIVDCRIGATLFNFGIYLAKVGIITIDSVLGAGTVGPSNRFSDTFIYLTPAHGTVTIINCECEAFTNSIHVSPSAKGNIGWPIVVINSALGPDVRLASNCDYISLGNRYLPNTVHCEENGTDVMIYSFGDIFAPNEGDIPQPEYDFTLFENSRVVSRANRFRVDFGRPTRIGGQAGPTPANLPLEENPPALAVAPFAAAGAQIALCNPAGGVLFNVRAEQNALIFQDAADVNLMRLDGGGNLYLLGKVFETNAP